MAQIKKSDFFKRQTAVAEFGEKGQQKLQDSKILVVGSGGLGSMVAVGLAASGIGKLHLVDHDKVAVSNLHRQVFYTLEDVGGYKSEILALYLKQRYPFTKESFSTEPITKKNAIEWVGRFDVIVDATDSLPTKYLLNDACVLQRKPLVYGSLYKFDGYVSTFNLLQENGRYSANLRDAFPKMSSTLPNCEEAGTLNPIVGMIANAQVNEVLKSVAQIGKPLVNTLLIYNALQNTQLKVAVIPKIKQSAIASIYEKQSYFDASCEPQHSDWLITSKTLRNTLGNPTLEIIAVLPNLETPFQVQQTLPIQEFDPHTFEIDPYKVYVMVCQTGTTSYKVTKQLREKYPTLNVLSLKGGIRNYHEGSVRS